MILNVGFTETKEKIYVPPSIWDKDVVFSSCNFFQKDACTEMEAHTQEEERDCECPCQPTWPLFQYLPINFGVPTFWLLP